MDNITFKLVDNTLCLIPRGRIDSNNAAMIQDEFFSIIGNNNFEKLVLDADDLEYISSAGLRIVLKLAKENKGFKIVNASTDVYDIFDMTGFTEMITIEKAYRKFSVDGCKIIGEGAKGTVYRYNEDTIIKVYKSADVLPEIQNERDLAKKAFVLGIPTAISYDVVKVGDKFGSVFELLDAKNLSELIVEEPENLKKYCKGFTDLLKQIHGTKVKETDMPNGKNIVFPWVQRYVSLLGEETSNKLLKMLNELPSTMTMIHGDYHTNNVMLQNGELLLIDMDTLCHGHPIIELAIINFTYGLYGKYDNKNATAFLGISFDQACDFWKNFMEMYFETTDSVKLQEYQDKIDIITYLRIINFIVKRKIHEDVLDECINNLKKLVDKYDSLEF